MNLGAVIEVAIGVVFVWLVISLAAIQIQEWIASWLKFREKDLEKAIGKMLANPQLTKDFYNHPIIQNFAKKPGEKPIYIPPREFTQTLFNILITAGTENSAIQQALESLRMDVVSERLAGIVNRKEVQQQLDALIEKAGSLTVKGATTVLDEFKLLPSFQKLAAIEGMKDAMDGVPSAVQAYLEAAAKNKVDVLTDLTPKQIEDGITAIGKLNPTLERSLKSMIAGVNNCMTGTEKAMAVARGNFESWFNNSMENLSGLYKRRSQWISFGIGLFLSITMSVNSIALVQKLWIDPTARAILVANAAEFKMPAPTSAPATSAPDANVPNATATPATTETPQVTSPTDIIRNSQLQFEGLNLPIGWASVKLSADYRCIFAPRWAIDWFESDTRISIQGVPSWDGTVCYRPVGTTVPITSTEPTYEEALRTDWLGIWFVGIFITALATVQGAPFWFDMLKNLINLRGAGSRPPTTQETTTEK